MIRVERADGGELGGGGRRRFFKFIGDAKSPAGGGKNFFDGNAGVCGGEKGFAVGAEAEDSHRRDDGSGPGVHRQPARRIIVGEIRDEAALDMLQAMNTGHDGSLSTIHANTTRDAMARLDTMVLMAGMDLPERAIREQIAAALNVILQLVRFPDGTRKIVKISEITGMEGNTIVMHDVFVFSTGTTPDLIRAKPATDQILQGNCVRCHEDTVDAIMAGVQPFDRRCWDCHRDVAHGDRGISLIPLQDSSLYPTTEEVLR